jgi:predicted DNA-binding transcriptional regulator AlpA
MQRESLSSASQHPPRQYLTAKHVCKKLCISRSNLYAKVKDKTLPAPLKLGRSSLWIESEIEAAIERKAV